MCYITCDVSIFNVKLNSETLPVRNIFFLDLYGTNLHESMKE
jgi:hypothetical protein